MFRSIGIATTMILLGLSACDAPRISNPQDALLSLPPPADYDALSLMARCRNALVLGRPGTEPLSSRANPVEANTGGMIVSLGYGDADNPSTYTCVFDKGHLIETKVTEPKPSGFFDFLD
jgi:hypothetical protein